MKWYNTHEVLELNTPSRQDGVEFEDEARYRKEGARFIMDIGNKLGLYLFVNDSLWSYSLFLRSFHRFFFFVLTFRLGEESIILKYIYIFLFLFFLNILSVVLTLQWLLGSCFSIASTCFIRSKNSQDG